MCNWSNTLLRRRISMSTGWSVQPGGCLAASMRGACGSRAAKVRLDAHERAAEVGSDEAGAAGAAGAGNAAQPANARRAGRWTGGRGCAGDLVGVSPAEAAGSRSAGRTEHRTGDAGGRTAALAEQIGRAHV